MVSHANETACFVYLSLSIHPSVCWHTQHLWSWRAPDKTVTEDCQALINLPTLSWSRPPINLATSYVCTAGVFFTGFQAVVVHYHTMAHPPQSHLMPTHFLPTHFLHVNYTNAVFRVGYPCQGWCIVAGHRCILTQEGTCGQDPLQDKAQVPCVAAQEDSHTHQ